MNPNRGYETFAPLLIGDPNQWSPRRRTDDKKPETPKERSAWNSVRRSEQKYARQLRSVATQIGAIIRALAVDGNAQVPLIEQAMRRYAEMLRPWARAVGSAMLADVSRRDEAVWAALGQDMSRNLRDEIQRAPTGEALKKLLDEQVHLITSLPLDAATRVHEIATNQLYSGARAGELAKQILKSGDVSKSRANLIARTEVARAASGLVQARATYVGSEGYIWRTAEDADVRRSHKGMSGRFVKWSDPPVLDKMRGHAGQLPNCRCYPEPVVPDFANIH
jgi:SPP1 gp7 family putative phage head morphogenesis protein